MQSAITENLTAEDFVSTYAASYNRFSAYVTLLKTLFQYVNRYVQVKQVEGQVPLLNVESMCWNVWQTLVVSEQSARLKEAFLFLLNRERAQYTGISSDLAVVASSIYKLSFFPSKCLPNFTLYKSIVEASYLASLEIFYPEFFKAVLLKSEFAEYLKLCAKITQSEEKRVDFYLNSSSHNIAKNKFYECSISSFLSLYVSNFTKFLESSDLENLKIVYTLASKVEGMLKSFLLPFEKFCCSEIWKTLSEAQATLDQIRPIPLIYYETFNSLYKKLKVEIALNVFSGNINLVVACDKAFKTAINKNAFCETSMDSAQYLAKYTDYFLKKDQVKADKSVSFSSRVDNLIILFRFLEDKDVFQQHYGRYLSQRLINGSSEAEEYESLFISKLKDACGFEFTSKFQNMFADIALCKTLNTNFTLSSQFKGGNLDVYFMILCSGSWPIAQILNDSQLQIPKTINESIKTIESFYIQRHSGRKLLWLYHCCRTEVEATFGGTKYLLLLSLYQATVLELFNTSLAFSFSQIQAAVKLCKETLAGILEVFVRAKIICASNCDPQDWNTYSSGDFCLNEGFCSKKTKINLNVTLKSETKNEVLKPSKGIDEDRSILIQAAIVRIMKSQKSMKFNQLVNEAVANLQSKFNPQVSDIKRNIEMLIEKEYLERQPDEIDVLNYIS